MMALVLILGERHKLCHYLLKYELPQNPLNPDRQFAVHHAVQCYYLLHQNFPIFGYQQQQIKYQLFENKLLVQFQ